jgi:hypothetical protein
MPIRRRPTGARQTLTSTKQAIVVVACRVPPGNPSIVASNAESKSARRLRIGGSGSSDPSLLVRRSVRDRLPGRPPGGFGVPRDAAGASRSAAKALAGHSPPPARSAGVSTRPAVTALRTGVVRTTGICVSRSQMNLPRHGRCSASRRSGKVEQELPMRSCPWRWLPGEPGALRSAGIGWACPDEARHRLLHVARQRRTRSSRQLRLARRDEHPGTHRLTHGRHAAPSAFERREKPARTGCTGGVLRKGQCVHGVLGPALRRRTILHQYVNSATLGMSMMADLRPAPC